MRVQVEVVCAPHPVAEIEEAMRSAGERLALVPDSVSVEVREREDGRFIAVLEFEMRRAAQYKVVDDIRATARRQARAFYEDLRDGSLRCDTHEIFVG